MTVTLILGALALLGVPLFVVIAAAALWGYHQSGIDLQAIAIEIFGVAEMPILAAIPLFTFAGYLISEGGAPARLVRISRVLLGWMPGGLAVISLMSCAIFTAFTGASGVTIIALGALLYPALREAGYPENFNLGLVTTSGSLGLLFAPSLPLILYGVVAKVSIDDLFVAGILPGTLMLVLLAGWSFWVNRDNRQAKGEFSWVEARAALWASRWEIPLPFVVLGG
ncbi:MAG: TRAP transporter large permease subunit, partial [Gammaproteobacteria bacterium]